jgi:nucleotide-binding universal stress UspA family protein
MIEHLMFICERMKEMKTFQHLVVAFDGTEDGKDALELGIQISKQLHSELSVIHIQKNDPSSEYSLEENSGYLGQNSLYLIDDMNNHPVVPEPSNLFETEEHNNATFAVKSETRRLLDHHHVKGNVNVLYGEPSEAIISFAADHDADLIVVGSRNMSNLKRLLFGSVSEKVSHRSNIPVLIAK